MANEKDNYITAGELASLYGIPKQTLLYYDKNELLIPEFINENGYRFYSVSQYLTLEIILNMRKLNIPIQNIKSYLQNRNLENFEQIILEKSKECDRIVAETEKLKTSLQLSLKAIEKIRKTRLDQIQINFQEEKFLFLSELLTESMNMRDRIKILSRHNQAAFSPKHFKELTTGWIINKDHFFHKRFNKTQQFFTPVSQTFSKKHVSVRPAGLYLTLRFEGTYYQKMSLAYEKIQTFMQINHLKALGDIYVFPLKNHWITEDFKTYINQISFQVEYTDNAADIPPDSPPQD